MINHKAKLLLIVMACIATTISCNTPKKMLCRTWDVVQMDFDASRLSLAAGMKERLIKQYEDSARFAFTKEGIYTVIVPEMRDTGTWELSKKGDSLYAKAPLYGMVAKIKALTKDSLNLDSKTTEGISINFVCKPVVTPGTK